MAGGLGAMITGGVILAIYWLRKWIKWNYNEKEE